MPRLPEEGSSARTIMRVALTYAKNLRPNEHDPDHKVAVGGHWATMGPLQFEFLKNQGLKPHHYFLDIGCGSLRAGRFLIPYLESGHYMGFDLDEPLVREGLAKEIPREVQEEKRPSFSFNDRLDFSAFADAPDFAIAQSVFTHLVPQQIVTCLTNLKRLAPHCRFFATFNETVIPFPNSLFSPHAQRTFYYTQGQMRAWAKQTGWTMRYIGDWGHPRSQKMTEFSA